MSGRWIKRKTDEHECRKPVWEVNISVGDIWECYACGKQWGVTKFDFNDGPCGAVWIKWVEQTGNTR